MGKTTVIVNPTAGRGKAAGLWPQIKQCFDELYLTYDVCFTKAKGDATRLAAQAIEAGSDSMISVGGDGTLHEIVNGIPLDRNTAIGAVPAGSGNDFIRTFGVNPSDWRSACQVIAEGHTRSIDIGQVGDRHFVNVAGSGFDAAVTNCANTWAKRYVSGGIAYVLALLRTIVEFKTSDIELDLDGEKVQLRGWLVAVANAQYFGGGMWIAPKAEVDDGLFDICVLGELSKPGLLKEFPSVFKGKHVNHPAVHLFRAKSIKVNVDPPFLTQADGEPIGYTPCEFTIHPKALRVFAKQNNRSESS